MSMPTTCPAIEIQDDPLGDFTGFHARLFRQVDVEGIVSW